MPRIRLPSSFLLTGLLAAVPAHAKSATWWDCFFHEFEVQCSGEAAKSSKSACDSKARTNCDEEERRNELSLRGVNANKDIGKAAAKPFAEVVGKPSNPEDASAVAVEGRTPSGDNTVLGVDVTLPISEAAEAYKARNIRGCRPIDDATTRVLCLDAPGGAGGTPIELVYYRGRLVSLDYESDPEKAVHFSPAVQVAEEKTGAKAVLGAVAEACQARFPLAGGTLTLRGSPAGPAGACAADAAENATLAHVEWAPPRSVQREIASEKQGAPAQPKTDEVRRTKALLPL